MDKLLFKRILVAVLSLLVVVYVAYLLISANFNMYPTENAVMTTVSRTIRSNAFIIRDETILTNNTNGVLSYSCSKGEEINSGGEIAKIYSNESDAVAQTVADKLEEQKTLLESLKLNTIAGNISIDVINNSIKSKLITYIDDVNTGSIGSIQKDSANLLYSVNQRYLFTGKTKSFSDKIAGLQAQIDSLRASSADSIGTVKAPRAGYFSEFCDGYENSVKYSDIDKLTLESLRSIKPSKVSANAAGKIIGNFSWYVACEVTGDEAASLKMWDSTVSVLFSEASTEKIPASIYKIQKSSKEDKALVILQCDYMDTGLLEARQEPIEVGLGEFTGLRVSKRAVHDDYATKVTYDDNDNEHKEQKKVQGVYVLYGSEVRFKEISIIYADKDYVICDPNPQEGVMFSDSTVLLYDQVIVKGDDLYDGKVIA